MKRNNQILQGGEWYVLAGCTLLGLGIGMAVGSAGAGIIIGLGAGCLMMVIVSALLNT